MEAMDLWIGRSVTALFMDVYLPTLVIFVFDGLLPLHQLLPEQAAVLLNQAAKTGAPATKSGKSGVELPGSESEPANRTSIRM